MRAIVHVFQIHVDWHQIRILWHHVPVFVPGAQMTARTTLCRVRTCANHQPHFKIAHAIMRRMPTRVSANKQCLHPHAQVDVDSSGRKCKERMLDVVSRIPRAEPLYSDFQVSPCAGHAPLYVIQEWRLEVGEGVGFRSWGQGLGHTLGCGIALYRRLRHRRLC